MNARRARAPAGAGSPGPGPQKRSRPIPGTAKPNGTPATPVRIVVAHASPLFADALWQHARQRPDVSVDGVCRDWQQTVAAAAQLQPDVLSLDAALPGLPGPGSLAELIAETRPRVVLTATDGCGFAADIVSYLEAGAVDFVLRRPEHTWTSPTYLSAFFARVHLAARVPRERIRPEAVPDLERLTAAHPEDTHILLGDVGAAGALLQLLPRLSRNTPGVLCVALSLPGPITRALARYLEQRCLIPVREAHPGDILTPGTALVLPGSFLASLRPAHDGRPTIFLTPREPDHRNGLPLDRTLAAFAGSTPTHALVLSGAGPDGILGAQALSRAGGQVRTAAPECGLLHHLAASVHAQIPAAAELPSLPILPAVLPNRVTVAMPR